MIEVSFVIVSYNVKELLITCLDSIYRFITPDIHIEVIIIDNHSSDESAIVVKKKYPRVCLIENKFNAGFSAANNQGMEIAKGKYIFLLNPDTLFFDYSIQLLYKKINTKTNLCILAPRLLDVHKKLQVSAWTSPALFGIILEAFYLHKLFNSVNYSLNQFKSEFSAGMVSGAAMFFQKQLINKIGMFDADLFWMEDADFCYRAKQSGAEIIYFPDAQLIHYGGQSSSGKLNITIANQLLSKIKYFKKHYGWFLGFTATMFIFLQIISRIIIFLLIILFSKTARNKMNAYIFSLGKFFKYILFQEESIIN